MILFHQNGYAPLVALRTCTVRAASRARGRRVAGCVLVVPPGVAAIAPAVTEGLLVALFLSRSKYSQHFCFDF